jgi:hypothetical protein
MIKVQELKIGDYVIAHFEEAHWRGEVTAINREDRQVRVKTEVQEFWYPSEKLTPIMLDHQELVNLGFNVVHMDDGAVKYMKGPFRVLLQNADDFTAFDIWYREDRRHIKGPITVHQLQNHYLQMTKVELHPN